MFVAASPNFMETFMPRVVPTLLAQALFATVPVAVEAQTSDPLQARIEALERELAALKSEIRARADAEKKAASAPAAAAAAPTVATAPAVAAVPAAAAPPTAAGPDVKVTTPGGIRVETSDGNFSAVLGGRLFVDQAFYDEDKTRMGDGAEIRSARIEIGGTLYKDWFYKIQADFGAGVGSGSAVFKDAYIGYQGIAPFEFTVGNQLEPISLDALTSGKYLTFMEPALPVQSLPDRRLGAKVSARGSNWTAAAGLFSSNVDTTANDPAGEGDSGWDVGGRVTFAPLFNDTQLVHLGFAVNDRNPNSEILRYRARPESHVTAARFIDTGAAGITNANNAVIYQPELALVFGSFHMQGEYQWLNVERGNGSPTLNFHGWYAQAGWFLTGEVRRYLIRDTPDSATFGRVRPRNNLGDGGFGAFEIAARYSGLDLSDRDVRGGTERNITLGLNWYVNPYMRFMFNYIRVNNDNEALGNVANLIPPNANGSNDDPRIYQLRGQVDF
jgi:phosphate-selective porin OprO/OprP